MALCRLKLKWHSVGSNSCYACTRWDGHTFSRIDDVPELPVHPNCKCYIEAIEPEMVKLEHASKELASSKTSAEKDISELQNYLNAAKGFASKAYSEGKETLEDLKQIYKTLDIFLDNYFDMRDADTIGADKYFHSKANAEAAQLGETAEKTAKFISDMREVVDRYTNVHLKKMTVEAALKDEQEDQKANEYGRKVGRENPAGSMKEFLDRYRPKGLDDKY